MSGFSVPEIEQASISAMMQWEEARNEASINLKPEYYSEERNSILFREVLDEWNSGKTVDLILLTQRLRDRLLLETIGGVHYVTETWIGSCHSSKAMPFYIDRILEEHEKRKCVKTCAKTIEDAPSIENIVEETVSALSEIPVRRLKERSLRDAFQEKLERMEQGEPDADVIKTGLEKLDDKSPLRKGDMPLIVGERKSGKSILALTIAENVSRRGLPVLYFSLEDTEPKLIDRMFAGLSRIPMTQHHVKKLTDEEVNSAQRAAVKGSELPITIKDDVFDLPVIISLSRQFNARGKADLIIVDYAQLVRQNAKERRLEVEKVSRDLRLLAMELSIPIIVLAQLNKDGETRETKALEMDATACWQMSEIEDEHNKRLLSIPWQRNGESGIVFPVTWLGNIARVENFVEKCGNVRR